MRNTLLGIALAGLLAITGCGPVVSIQPAWDILHEVKDPGLEGVWLEQGDDCIIAVSRQEAHYVVAYMEDGKASRYEGHLFQLGNFLFLDAVPDEGSLQRALDGDAYLPVIPVHFFVRLTRQGDALEISLLGEDGLREAVETGAVSLAGQQLTDGLIVTASTPELQAALLGLAPRDEFWDEASRFRRVSR